MGTHDAVEGSGRECLARALHDLTSPRLIRVAVDLSAIASMTDGVVQRRLAAVIREVDAVIATLRQFVFPRPERDAERVELPLQVQSILQRAEVERDVTGHLDVNGRLDDLPEPLARTISAVVSEAVRNVVDHSRARTVTVRLARAEESAEVVVVDDGIGLPDRLCLGMGLATSAALARAHQGSFAISRIPAGGTALMWRAPLNSSTDAGA